MSAFASFKTLSNSSSGVSRIIFWPIKLTVTSVTPSSFFTAFSILAAQFEVDADSITADTNFAEELNADSLDVVDMLMSLEDEFDVEIPDEEIENIQTVGDLVSFIEEHM